MGLNPDQMHDESGVTGGPDSPDTGLPTPGDQPGPATGSAGSGGADGQGGGEPGLTRDPLPSGLADGAYVAKFVIAVDGPAGSGKSSVSRAAARALGFGYQDTGAAYRALAWHALQLGVDLDDASAILASWDTFEYEIGTDPDAYFVRVGGTDVTDAIRTPEVTGAVAHIAKLPEVRERLVQLFRNVMRKADARGIITEGRDITTVVAPDAEVRILLTADEQVRMARRSAEVTTQSAAETSAALARRDAADAKVVDFMNAADGVTTLDSTDLDFDQTVQAVVDLARTAGH
ncbi:cytidylate kinase [Curtobacterium sp. PhB130]|uniref:(d)CMP kinase n=1 Tax=Curtobacterium sp. PhB136 TaxID=2485181 RepID=UPI000FA7DD17|nr:MULTISPECIES: (d)CMP kinase [unclassified Curtobacterium]ROP58499.1 cytidylate kinase [Curtobacterium sp. ZW137]ROS74668.1 cytidylate kinase [Curtobacterium sp. PhB130]TCK59222.1 cytidylate kinase [Curtobacterium sp. PhB136]